MEQFERTINLIGEENFNKILNKNIIVFGVGGVGGYVVEMLVRSGVSNLTIVDFDSVSISNLNRQIIALNSTLNMPKVSTFETRLKDINKNLNLTVINNKITAENLEEFNLNSFDYVIDCIDSFKDKLSLIEYCYKNNIKIISSMGAGNRYKNCDFIITDIYKTTNDALARKLRGELKKRDVKKLTVVCSNTPSDNLENKGKVLSIAFVPAMCGIKLAGFVINEIIEN